MSRRDNAALRCPRCRMLGLLCVCALMPEPKLATRTRLVLFIHRFEARKPTNTGQLAAECLANAEVRIRGRKETSTPPFVVEPGTRPLLLFPDDHATPLDQLPPSDEPSVLIVPDGTWRQAQRVRHRVPGLADVACVTLPAGAPSTYRLRTEIRDGGLATLEAIARAFAFLGEPAAAAAMEHVFRAMVERTLWSRGTLAAADVTGGIPEGAIAEARAQASGSLNGH